jgi:phosphoribosylglycinamide formyltransferase 1
VVFGCLRIPSKAVFSNIKGLDRTPKGNVYTMGMLNLGVLASGGGTNLQAIIDACEAGAISARVAVVISDKAGAGALERAARHGIPAVHISVAKTGTEAWVQDNREIVDSLRAHGVDLVCLAGYMRKVTPEFLAAYEGAVINIHPALLPSFVGHRGQGDAVDYGVKLAGATVHFVDAEFDHGPVIIQAAVPVRDDDTEGTLARRILAQEHRIYSQAIQWYAEGRLRIVGRQVILEGRRADEGGSLTSPPLEIP